LANILIVDDDHMLCAALESVIQRMGYCFESAHSLDEGLRRAAEGSFDAVILDVWLPDGNGLEFLQKFKESPSEPEVIILTGAGDPDGAELAIMNGAWSYITNPPTISKIKLPVERAVQYREEKRARRSLVSLKREGIIGESKQLAKCLDLVSQAAATMANVLITGETGTGKELVARAIHANSPRAHKPFVVVDCAALPGNLVESVLFGHEKGSFTGADRRNEGLVREADGGSLFLDEVGELPMSVQKSFLRVLQEHRFRPVGGGHEQTSDFRLIAATNRNLERMVSSWEFRQDLLFRLKTITIPLPPLREREGDIRLIACHFLDRSCQRKGMSRKGCSSDFFEVLEQYAWPGNVRELLNALESAVAEAGPDHILYPRRLPVHIRAQAARQALVEESRSPDSQAWTINPNSFPRRKDYRSSAMAELESQYLRELLALTGGHIPSACELSGLSRARLYALLKTYGLGKSASE